MSGQDEAPVRLCDSCRESRARRDGAAVLQEIDRNGTQGKPKRGKPVAKLVPIGAPKDDIYGFYKGKGAITGDIVSPALSLEEWGNLG